MTVIMEGYDAILISNFWAYPTFQRKYGRWVGVTETTRSGYQMDPAWQAGLGNGAGVGAFFGTYTATYRFLFLHHGCRGPLEQGRHMLLRLTYTLIGGILNGFLVNRFGQRNTIVGALIALTCFIFIVFFANGPEVLLVGQIFCGIPWGIFATSAPAYASEMLPMVLRVYFTSWTNMCFILGQFLAAGVLRACLVRDDEWGYRIPFALQVSNSVSKLRFKPRKHRLILPSGSGLSG